MRSRYSYLLCQSDSYVEQSRCTRAYWISPRSQPVGPAFILDIRHDTARTLMTDEMTDVSARLRFEQVFFVDEGEVEAELSGIHDRLCEALHAEVNIPERNLLGPPIWRQLLVDNAGEELSSPLLQIGRAHV